MMPVAVTRRLEKLRIAMLNPRQTIELGIGSQSIGIGKRKWGSSHTCPFEEPGPAIDVREHRHGVGHDATGTESAFVR